MSLFVNSLALRTIGVEEAYNITVNPTPLL